MERTFTVGRTSEALQSIGIQDRGIIWHSKKAADILRKHSGMTRETIKQVPQILENPIVVLKSKNMSTRIVVFGEIRDGNNAPVTAVLELQPTNRGGQVLNLNLIASAYGKTNNIKNFIQNSELLYLDENKNRTNAWLQGLGLQLPADTTMYGSIGSITYQDGKVKIKGVPFSRYIQSGEIPLSPDEDSMRDKAIDLRRYADTPEGEADAREIDGIDHETLSEQNLPDNTDGNNKYTYEALIAKPDMMLAEIDDSAEYTANSTTRKNIVDNAIRNAAKTVGFTDEDGNVFVRVDDTGEEILLTTHGLRHGLDRRLSVNAPVTLKAGEILKRAIRINELSARNQNVSEGKIFLGAAKNQSGQIYIVRFIVERYTNELQSVDTLYAINAKKESAALLPAISDESDTLTDSTIRACSH